MIQRIETLGQIHIHNPFPVVLPDKQTRFGDRLVATPPWAVPIARWMKVRIKYRLKNVQQGLLHHSVADRRDAEQPFPPHYPWGFQHDGPVEVDSSCPAIPPEAYQYWPKDSQQSRGWTDRLFRQLLSPTSLSQRLCTKPIYSAVFRTDYTRCSACSCPAYPFPCSRSSTSILLDPDAAF